MLNTLPWNITDNKGENVYVSYDTSIQTSAIVFHEKSNPMAFLVLKGNHFEEYRNKTQEECIDYFIDNYSQVSSCDSALLNSSYDVAIQDTHISNLTTRMVRTTRATLRSHLTEAQYNKLVELANEKAKQDVK